MPTRRRHNKWLMGLVILVGLIVVIVVVVVNLNRGPENGETHEDEKAAETVKTDDKKEEEASAEVKKEPVPQYTGEDPNTAESLTGVVSYAGVSGENLIVRVNIDQYLTGGDCTMELKRDGATFYTKSTTIESSVSTSTCNGFSVPVAEVGTGKLVVEITLKSGDKYGKLEREVNI